ncbi:MAG: A/G-specific adenine glycosylase [Acidobacteriota bacterium]
MRRRLLAHYDASRRSLPWRKTRDPYRILVSEFMLQQTTVAAVIPHYRRFVRCFPRLESLASAGEEDVLAQWAGLGYYARARRLWQACRELTQVHGGRFPEGATDLARLPGIGPYTAGAISSIAFDHPEPAVDGNVTRVLSRLLASRGRGAAEARRMREAAARLVAGNRPGDVNQALMELGATLCTPRSPACQRCPLRRSCLARREGRPGYYPLPPPRPKSERRHGCVVVCQNRQGGVYLVRRPVRGSLPGLWDLPGISGYDAGESAPPQRAVEKAAVAQLGCPVRLGRPLTRVRHTVMNRRIVVEVRQGRFHRGRSPQVRGAGAGSVRVHTFLEENGARGLTAGSRKVLEAMERLR